jgi:hypothetical protein
MIDRFLIGWILVMAVLIFISVIRNGRQLDSIERKVDGLIDRSPS